MKKILLSAIAALTLHLMGSAQPMGGMQRQTPEERVAIIHKKLDSAFQLGPEKLNVLDTALTVLFRAQDKRMQELFSGGGNMPDREQMMAERQKYMAAREEMMKAVLSEEQYAIWKDKIEPSMRPQGGMGAGRNRQ